MEPKSAPPRAPVEATRFQIVAMWAGMAVIGMDSAIAVSLLDAGV